MTRMSAGGLTAEPRRRQWVVNDADGATVAWIVPACGTWVVSLFDASKGKPPGPFFDPKSALESLAKWW